MTSTANSAWSGWTMNERWWPTSTVGAELARNPDLRARAAQFGREVSSRWPLLLTQLSRTKEKKYFWQELEASAEWQAI